MAHNITPGYCVVERQGSLDYQARELFRDTRTPVASLFMKFNADTQYLKPEQILIVADPDTPAPPISHMLNTLRQAKNNTTRALQAWIMLTPDLFRDITGCQHVFGVNQ